MTNDQWRSQQEKLFVSGEQFLPEYFRPIVLAEHFAHLHPDKSGNLRYIKNPDNGREGLYSRISIRGYLEKYREDKYGFKEIDSLVTIFNALIQDEDGLKFAVTSDEIVGVYIKSNLERPALASSCMRTLFAHLPHHPTYAYGTGDLAVAYLGNSNGLTEERAVCWPEKKIYGRVFGTGLLHGLLQKRGYKKTRYYPDGEGSFMGARLFAIPIPHNTDVYLMPYVDEKLWAIKKGEYLILTEAYNSSQQFYSIRYQSGTTVEHPVVRLVCPVCEIPYTRDELHPIQSLDSNGRYTNNYWCAPCVYEHSFRDQGDGRLYDRRTVKPVKMHDGSEWSEKTFHQYGFTCAKTGLNYHVDNRAFVFDENNAVAPWCLQAIEDNAYFCQKSNSYYNNSVPKVIMYDGRFWTQDKFNSYGGVCDRTGRNYPRSKLSPVYDISGKRQVWCPGSVAEGAWSCYLTNKLFTNEVPSISLTNFTGKRAAKHVAIERGYTIREDGTNTI